MNAHQTFLYCLVLAEMVKVEGMKAANAERAIQGTAPAYDADDFFRSCDAIQTAAQQLINS